MADMSVFIHHTYPCRERVTKSILILQFKKLILVAKLRHNVDLIMARIDSSK
jgi:hypothetical protein